MSIMSTLSTQALSNQVVKRSVLAAGAALVLAGTAAGVAGAQQAPSATTTPGASGAAAAQKGEHHEQFLTALAAKLGVPVDRLRQAFADTRQELGLPEHKDRRGGFRFGPGGPGHHILGASLEAAAKAIGVTTEQLRQELPGKSLADVARAHNVNPARVADALKAEANTHIDAAVSAGKLPADQAAQAKQRAAERIDQLMTRQMPAGMPGPRGRGALPGGAAA